MAAGEARGEHNLNADASMPDARSAGQAWSIAGIGHAALASINRATTAAGGRDQSPARRRGRAAGRSTHPDDGRRSAGRRASPVVENPAGTDIAGFDIIVTYQHDRIQSMYVVIAVPGNLGRIRDVRHRTARPASPAGRSTRNARRTHGSASNICAWRASARLMSASCQSLGLRDFELDRVLHPFRPLRG